MPIKTFTASSFQKRLTSGKTQPCIFLCENDEDETCEYVVKIKAGFEDGVNGLAAELLGSQLAQFFDIPSPEPAIITIEPDILESINTAELKEKLTNSIGPNFGSRFMPGYSTWPVEKRVPSDLRQLAADIFAFDALTQNTDRRTEKPNVLWQGDELFVIDHEKSFSFIYAILNDEPYRVTSLQFLKGHIFYPTLKGAQVSLERFAGALEALSDQSLSEMVDALPIGWRTDNTNRITAHIKEVRDNSGLFIEEIRRFLQ